MTDLTVDPQIPPPPPVPESQEGPTRSEAPAETNWYKDLSEPLRANKNITRFKTLEDFASWQANASKLIGKKVQDMAPDEIKQFLTPEELLQAHQARGLPNSVEEYELPSLASYSDQEVVQGLKERAFKAGITPTQAEELLKYNAEVTHTQAARQKEVWTNELLDRYGADTGEVMQRAAKVAQTYFSPEMMKQLDASGLGHNPGVIEALDKMARDMMPDHIPKGTIAERPSDKAKVEAEIQSLLRDPQFMQSWRNQEHKAKHRLNDLYGQLAKFD